MQKFPRKRQRIAFFCAPTGIGEIRRRSTSVATRKDKSRGGQYSGMARIAKQFSRLSDILGKGPSPARLSRSVSDANSAISISSSADKPASPRSAKKNPCVVACSSARLSVRFFSHAFIPSVQHFLGLILRRCPTSISPQFITKYFEALSWVVERREEDWEIGEMRFRGLPGSQRNCRKSGTLCLYSSLVSYFHKLQENGIYILFCIEKLYEIRKFAGSDTYNQVV